MYLTCRLISCEYDESLEWYLDSTSSLSRSPHLIPPSRHNTITLFLSLSLSPLTPPFIRPSPSRHNTITLSLSLSLSLLYVVHVPTRFLISASSVQGSNSMNNMFRLIISICMYTCHVHSSHTCSTKTHSNVITNYVTSQVCLYSVYTYSSDFT